MVCRQSYVLIALTIKTCLKLGLDNSEDIQSQLWELSCKMIAAFSPEAYLYCCMLNCCYSPPTYHPLLFFNRTTTAGFPVISHNALYTILQSCFIYMIHSGRRVLSRAQDRLFSVNKVHQFTCSCQPTAVFCH